MIMPVKHSGNLSVNRNTNGNSAKKEGRGTAFFLQEFEGELEQEDVDDFLRQFELELAEEEENEANESVNTQSSVDENAGNIADMVSNAVENSTAGSSATSEQTVSGDTQAAASADNAEFFEKT